MKKNTVLYQNLISIPVKDSREVLVPLDGALVPFQYRSPLTDMQEILGNTVMVRTTVKAMLEAVQRDIQTSNPQVSLLVTYGYRSIEIQTKYFIKELAAIAKEEFFSDPLALYEKVHTRIAVPTVAGHPTGGAVDVILVDASLRDIDFGSDLYDLSDPRISFFADQISSSAKANRHLLRKSMMKIGFAPFDEEWWHFSYGDREWSYYYTKPFALYNQINRDIALQQLINS